jgi:hypothetical protein
MKHNLKIVVLGFLGAMLAMMLFGFAAHEGIFVSSGYGAESPASAVKYLKLVGDRYVNINCEGSASKDALPSDGDDTATCRVSLNTWMLQQEFAPAKSDDK